MARKRRSDDPNGPLTSSEWAFVGEYLVHLNSTRAYQAAFPISSERTAAVQAHRHQRQPARHRPQLVQVGGARLEGV